MIPAPDYAEFLDREYLSTYVKDGGAAVKFVVATDGADATNLSEAIGRRAADAGYVVVRIDAAVTRVHMMEQLFFDLAQQVDWDGLAATAVRAGFAAAGYRVENAVDGMSADLTVETVAATYAVDPLELSRDVNRQLQERIYRDYAMAQEFRIAMLRLCQAKLGTGQVTEAEHAAVLDWLRGSLRQMSLLRSAMIFRRIGRHNARQLLFSLAHWLSVNGTSGLLLEIDLRRLGFARRPRPEEREGIYYTKAALFDAYELLRQLVDNTDELSNACVIVLASPEFLSDQNRGVHAYQALKLRIYDEVRDRNRDNPSSSLVRIGAA